MIFVEVLDRRGHVTARTRLDALPATIGRGYGNAVILDDRYVSPEHIRLSVADDGALVADDLASDNGLYEEPSGRRASRVAIQPGTRIRVGHTVLRFAAAGQPVAPAARDPLAGGGRRLRYTARATTLMLAAALGLSMLTSYLNSYDSTAAASLLSEALMLGVVLAAWAGVWALITRVTAHRFAFGHHLAVAAGVLLAAEVAYVLVDVTDVIEPGTAAAALVQTLLVIAGLGALLFGHLSLVATLAPARRLAWALGVAAGLVAFAEFTEFADRDSFDAVPSFVGSVRPMGSSAGHGVSLDAFIEGASELRLDVDALARVQRR